MQLYLLVSIKCELPKEQEKSSIRFRMHSILVLFFLIISDVDGQTAHNSPRISMRNGSSSQLTQINGRLVFSTTLSLANQTTDLRNAQDIFRLAINATQEISLQKAVMNGLFITIQYSAYVWRPVKWFNYTDANVWREQINEAFSRPSAVQRVFGPATKNRFSEAFMDVNECVSDWSDCEINANCQNAEPGFSCVCNTGYKGDGYTCIAITCTLSSAPPAPAQASSVFAYINETVIPSPPEILPYGTTIKFACSDKFKLVDSSSNRNGILVPSCQESGWRRVDVSCVMELEFRVAIGIAVTSSIIIALIVGCFSMHYCVLAERKARAKKATENEQLAYENHALEHVPDEAGYASAVQLT